jgi:hypothetical protein
LGKTVTHLFFMLGFDDAFARLAGDPEAAL